MNSENIKWSVMTPSMSRIKGEKGDYFVQIKTIDSETVQVSSNLNESKTIEKVIVNSDTISNKKQYIETKFVEFR